MTESLLQFLILWSLILLFFTCVGMLLFYEVDFFKEITGAFEYLIYSALGSWDIGIFQQAVSIRNIIDPNDILLPEANQTIVKHEPIFLTEDEQQLGQMYTGVYLILNFVIIMNLVIAILSTTYQEYSRYKKGLFYDS
jgi:hypothetical protein